MPRTPQTCVTDGTACALGRDRLGDVSLGLRDHRLQVLVEPGIGGFDVGRAFDERRRHARHLGFRILGVQCGPTLRSPGVATP
jgi:hypothetical protein